MNTITREELEKLYKENNNKIVTKKLNISLPTLIKYLKENEIELKGPGNRTGNRKKISVE